MTYYLVVYVWNGKLHYQKTDALPVRDKQVRQLAKEIDRFELSHDEASMSLKVLQRLAEGGLLKRYDVPVRKAHAFADTLGLNLETLDAEQIEQKFALAIADAGHRPLYRMKLERARRNALRYLRELENPNGPKKNAS